MDPDGNPIPMKEIKNSRKKFKGIFLLAFQGKMAEQEDPKLTFPCIQLSNTHICVNNTEHNPKTGRTDSPQLNVKKRPY